MTDTRVCIRGCAVAGVHWATCPDFAGEGTCSGCAPRAAKDMSLLCESCQGRLFRFLTEVPDLLGYMRTLADPTRVAVLGRVRGVGDESPAPTPSDLLDALQAVTGTLRGWAVWADGAWPALSSMEPAVVFADSQRKVNAILGRFGEIVNDLDLVTRLTVAVLDRNDPVDGVRGFWSVGDARAVFGLESRRNQTTPDPDDDTVIEVNPNREWGNPILSPEEAETVAGSARTFRRWRQKELIHPEGQVVIAGRLVQWFRYSDVVELKGRMRERMHQGKENQ